jgi:hypothetical protein
LKGDRVRREFSRFVQRLSIAIIKTTNSGSENDCSSKSRDTSCHVNRTRTSEVDGTHAKEGINGSGREEAVRGPEGMRNLRERW